MLDTDTIKISSVDFKNALKSITPASNRSNVSPGASLPEHLKPLLGVYVDKATEIVMKIFPVGQKIQGWLKIVLLFHLYFLSNQYNPYHNFFVRI